MPTISVFYGIVIQMFWRDHAPPHFHALYAEHEALNLRDLGVIRGSLPKRALALVLEWARQHQAELVEDWTLCSQLSPPETDRTVEVVPEVRHTVPWRVASVEALDNSRLRVTFVDGTLGEVRMETFLASPAVNGTVFELLRDPAEFVIVRIEMGAVQWPNGADLAPDAMYDHKPQPSRARGPRERPL